MTPHGFCRIVCSDTIKDVLREKIATKEEVKAVWVWRDGDTGDFHGPDEFYFYSSCCCLWDMRVKGWRAYSAKKRGEE